jgi:GAF domain-containing protein
MGFGSSRRRPQRRWPRQPSVAAKRNSLKRNAEVRRLVRVALSPARGAPRDKERTNESETPLDRLLKTRDVVHRADDSAAQVPSASARLGGAKSHLAVPMFKDEALVGAIVIYRQEVPPFTDKHIALVQNFAAQAVIAIENTRLLNELRQRTDDLTESLEQQTATSEVLKIISSSPGQLEPVFQAMLANATHLCEAKFASLRLSEGDQLRFVSLYNAPPALVEHWQGMPLVRPHPEPATGVLTKQVAQIDDVRTSPAYSKRDPLSVAGADLGGYRTVLAVPMLKESFLIGVITIYRQEVRSFTEKQIKLVSNFVAQAVIAIENARLLNELRESLEQQTATADVLRIISSSPGELAPVFESILENATRICHQWQRTNCLTKRMRISLWSHRDLVDDDTARRPHQQNLVLAFHEFQSLQPIYTRHRLW